MNTKSLIFLLALTFLFLFSGSSVVFANDFQDATDAYDRKDYETAYKLFLPFAEQGDADAQYNLGLSYYTGQGVPQDYKEAVKWWKLAAGQGLEIAQYNLGGMYYQGKGLPKDYVSAHMWFNICSPSKDEDCMDNRNIVEKEMTPQQIEKAQEMARNWKPKK